MKLIMFATRDRAADCFGSPFFMPTVGVAIRGFADIINSADTNQLMSSHPADFDLYELGVWDDSGYFEIHDRPRQVAVGKDLVRAPGK